MNTENRELITLAHCIRRSQRLRRKTEGSDRLPPSSRPYLATQPPMKSGGNFSFYSRDVTARQHVTEGKDGETSRHGHIQTSMGFSINPLICKVLSRVYQVTHLHSLPPTLPYTRTKASRHGWIGRKQVLIPTSRTQ